MHPCPCCGYRTLPARGDYDLCPVCWWEDEGGEPWECSGANGETLVEAQRKYLARRLPHRLRRGRVRAPRRDEVRDPHWRPVEVTDELVDRIDRATVEREQLWELERRRVAAAFAADPEGPFKDYNAGLRALRLEAPGLPIGEVEGRLADLAGAHGLTFSPAQAELLARRLQDEHFYRRHALHAVRWLARHARPGTLARHWRELRTGRIRVAG